jgi:hypothetical protein
MPRKDYITISQKHGVNPAIPKCFYCLKDKNEIILAGRLPKDAEAPRGAVWNKEPCDECKGYMQQGVILISVRTGETDQDNPYRTGGWVVVREDFIRRIVQPESLANQILTKRVSFVPDDAWDMLHLPRGAEMGTPQ